jgi:peptidyl-tRNA hydrolase
MGNDGRAKSKYKNIDSTKYLYAPLENTKTCLYFQIVVKCDSELALYDLHAKAMTQGFTTVLIRDAGHTQVAPGSVTALGIGPGEVESIVKDLKLL